MKYLITGGCGFLGSNLSAEVMRRSCDLVVFDNLYRSGATENLQWLKTQGNFKFTHGDMRCYSNVENVVRTFQPDVIFHLAGQVAMTTSLEDPRMDFEVNVVGGSNLLESVRRFCPNAAVVYSSTNKVYGDLEHLHYEETPTRYNARGYPEGFSESTPLDFRSPYGCSKGAVDQYMLDYARIFKLKTVVFRHSSIFGARQFSTYDQGWIGWFVQQAVDAKRGKGQKFTVSGNGKQVRDVLFISDLVQCYFKAAEEIQKTQGNAFNIGGGMDNSLSLLELFTFLEKELGVTLDFECIPWRMSDQRVFVADISKAQSFFQWKPKTDKASGLRNMIEWIMTDAKRT